MRKVILMILLGVVSNSAVARWVEVVHAKDNSYNIYADPDSIHKAGNIAEIWFMDDFNTPKEAAGGELYMSSKEKFSFNCKKMKWRTLVFSLYSGKMGEGAVIFSDTNPSKWQPILPDSKIIIFGKTACDIK